MCTKGMGPSGQSCGPPPKFPEAPRPPGSVQRPAPDAEVGCWRSPEACRSVTVSGDPPGCRSWLPCVTPAHLGLRRGWGEERRRADPCRGLTRVSACLVDFLTPSEHLFADPFGRHIAVHPVRPKGGIEPWSPTARQAGRYGRQPTQEPGRICLTPSRDPELPRRGRPWLFQQGECIPGSLDGLAAGRFLVARRNTEHAGKRVLARVHLVKDVGHGLLVGFC